MKNLSPVYFAPVTASTPLGEIHQATRELLCTLREEAQVTLAQSVPLKVHFGEQGNITFIKPGYYQGLLDFLKEEQRETCYMETSVLYGGQRCTKERHLATAEKHGFTQAPVIIADGDHGESFAEVPIKGHHFRSCKIGRAFMDYSQLMVLSHFKGHAMAGFGGAIKQLSMGCASKGGKLAMHMGIKPFIRQGKCKRCGMCVERCNEQAITLGRRASIDHGRCVGCGACLAICPHGATTVMSLTGIYKALFQGRVFREKLVEHALAAHQGKKNIYFNFALSITRGCDCEGKRMKPCMEDMGIFASTDPVAIDKACLDMAQKQGTHFKGTDQLHYAEKIGLGSTSYRLVEKG